MASSERFTKTFPDANFGAPDEHGGGCGCDNRKRILARVRALAAFYTVPWGSGYNLPTSGAEPITDYESFAVDIITDVLVWSSLKDGNTHAGLGDLLRRAHDAALAELREA